MASGRRGALARALALLALAGGCGEMPPGEAPDGGLAMDLAPDSGGEGSGCAPDCGLGFTCQGRVCVAEPSALWVVTATTGRMSSKDGGGDAWDPFNGLPDPLVCLTISGQRNCTAYKDDTVAPVWNHTFPSATATGLLGGITVEIEDYDPLDANDPMCPKGIKPVTMEVFKSGALSAGCAQGEVQLVLRPQ